MRINIYYVVAIFFALLFGSTPCSADCPVTPNGVYNVKCYGATGNWQYIGGASCSVSAPTVLNLTTGAFAPGDVGKTVMLQIGALGAGGGGYEGGTIATYVSNTQVLMQPGFCATSVTNSPMEWFTDDTVAINSAVAAAKNNGYVFFPCGNYATAGVNATDWFGGQIIGSGGGYGCVTLYTDGYIVALLDETGSPSFHTQGIALGSANMIGIPQVGLLHAPSTTHPGIDTIKDENIFVSGNYSTAARYYDRVCCTKMSAVQAWNYYQTPTSYGTMYTTTNAARISSAYTTTLPGSGGCGVFALNDIEDHGERAGGGASANFALAIDGCNSFQWLGGEIDSSNATGGIKVSNNAAGTVGFLTMIGTVVYSENGTAMNNLFTGPAMPLSNVYSINMIPGITGAFCAGCSRGPLLP